jgi:protocatechuate 3,4-dioxygenase beta subunit
MHAILLALLVSQPPQRQAPPPRDASATPATGTAVIRGRVFAADTKKPLRRARIVLNAPELGRDSRQTSTNLDGRYEIKDLPAGRYTITVNRSGYLRLRYGQRRPLEAAKPLQLADKQTVENVDFTLPRMSVISGRVFDESSDPVEGANVFALRTMWFEGKRRLVPAGNASTDDAGQFRIRSLSPGTYVLRANMNDTWTVTENGVDQTFGYVPTYQPTASDPGAARRVVVGIGQEIGNADVFLVPGRAVTVSGTAFDSHGRPIAGQSLTLGQETRGPEMAMFFGGYSGRVNGDGTFSIKNVVPGDYVIRARTAGEKGTEAMSMAVTVGFADVDNVSLMPMPGWSVTGSVVTDAGASPAFSPERMRLATRAVDGDRSSREGGGSPDNGRVKDDWTFTVGPTYGAAYLRVTMPDGWAVQSIQDRSGRDISDDAIDLRTSEELAGVRVIVTDKVTTVSGQLSDDKSQPVSEGTVLVFSESAEKWSEESRFVKSARLDQQGQYEIKGLPAATYLAVALDYVEDGIWNDPEFLESLRRYGTKVTLAEGEARSVPLKLTNLERQ